VIPIVTLFTSHNGELHIIGVVHSGSNCVRGVEYQVVTWSAVYILHHVHAPG